MIIAILDTMGTLILGFGSGCFFAMMWRGVRRLKQEGTDLSVQGDAVYERPGQGRGQDSYHVYAVIPCLNEQTVIASTVRRLLDDADMTVVVVDDASDDNTTHAVQELRSDRVCLVRRELPQARLGKGPALNAGLTQVRQLAGERGQDRNQVIVLVMDADGRLSDGALAEVLPLFDNERIGGVQLGVRIRNRNRNFWTRFQDFQFWAMSAITQLGRAGLGTTSLGGNGQFTRLCALNQLGTEPWNASLTEDLDLAISLSLNGWALTTTPYASVDQQAVETVKALVRQRTRWYQGHMLAGRRIGEIWGSDHIEARQGLEISAYLGIPWVLDLPWSIMWHYFVIAMIWRWNQALVFSQDRVSLLLLIVVWYLLAFGPSLASAFVYHKRDHTVPMATCLLLSHAFLITNYVFYFAAWKALLRILSDQNGWEKTDRANEATA
ncbi:glycosyltransferase [Streptomyces violascens]|uniref:glycosyltransferase n=1 Tax=Streptomyces violascens TaxID=67381 RepID=UPI0036C3506C